tara:strand:- start:57 stop:983 length:927 start_codon:yes stop_codon:yes gene_type:complete
MKKLILLLFIPYALIAQDLKIEYKVNDDKTVDFSYKKLSPNTVTVIVNFSFLENTMSSTRMVEKVSNPEGKLFKLKPMNNEQNIGFNYSYLFFNYDINPKVDDDFVYILPYKKEAQMFVKELSYLGSTYSNKKEPKGWKSYSFSSDEVQRVFPVRKGVVIDVVKDHDVDTTKTFTYNNKMNSVKIEHNDGTIALYSGFNRDEIFVNVGDIVYPKYNTLGKTEVYDARKKHRINFSLFYYSTKDGVKLSSLSKNNQTEIIYITPTFYQNGESIKLKKDFFYESDYNDKTLFQNFSKRQIKKYKKGNLIL